MEGSLGVKGLLLDSCALTSFLRGNPILEPHFQSANMLFLNPAVLAEVRNGFGSSRAKDRSDEILGAFVARQRVDVLPITAQTAIRYSEIWYYLRKMGKPIPTNDIWIAATAWEHGLTLLTLDQHFANLPQIIVKLEKP
ncbi:MAG: PIN domain-containing protein [Bryobacteraceae bacterium]|nr:PIN domain-containing protein [Bryobacteraceae bacterium]